MNKCCLLFDYGGVLVSSPFKRIEEYAAAYRVPGECAVDLVFGGPGERTHPWSRLERGLIQYDQYRVVFDQLARARDVHLPCPPLNVVYDLQPRKALLQTLTALPEGELLLGLATNNVAAMRSVWRAHVAGPRYTFVFDSSQMGVRKPDRAFFEVVVKSVVRAGVSLDRSWLIDDVPENVEAAKAAGLRGVLASESERALRAQVRRTIRSCLNQR